MESTHGQMSCQTCHSGPADRTFASAEEAHVGVLRDPSSFNEEGTIPACVGCHQNEVESSASSLHTNLWGEINAIEIRGGATCTVLGTDLEDSFRGKCATCHATCGQCHISRPTSVGGGFPVIATQYNSHRFRSPDMTEQCTACHGSRVGTDFQGELEGNVPDVHYSRGIFCKDCHSATEMHGDGQQTGDHYDHRYEVASMPRCEDCHRDGTAPSVVVDTDSDCTRCHINGVGSQPIVPPAALVNHAHHISNNSDCAHCHRDGVPASTPTNMQCQVCHSQPYKNCTNCHNLDTDEAAGEKFDINPSRIQFKIARNPSQYRDEYDNVLVRHVPVDPDTYADWGLELPDYLVAPTWKYTSPHNVILQTPQTTVPEGGSCYTACHSTPDDPDSGWFLRASDLAGLPDETANQQLVIPAGFPGDR